jgi:hypothetical protein
MNGPPLHTVQQLLWTLISAPRGAAAALAAMPEEERRHAESLVRAHGTLGAVDRLEIYANMYFFRIRDCIAEDFPALRDTLGPERFHNLITDYLLAHPSTHFSLRYAGQRLPEFLQHHPTLERWPWAAELAQLEWAIADAFDAADTPTLRRDDLLDRPAAEWPSLNLALVSSARLLHLRWPVAQVWEAARCGTEPPPLAPEDTAMRVWRQDLQVFHRVVDAAEMAALEIVRAGSAFADICAVLAERLGDEAGAQRAADLLSRWLDDALLTLA